jgi:hypothetical protein
MENFAKNQWDSSNHSTFFKKLRTVGIYIHPIKYLMNCFGEPWSETLGIALIFDVCFGF